MLFDNYFISELRNRPTTDVVLIDNGREITVSEVIRRSTQLAQNLSNQGLTAQSHVILAVAPSIDFLLILYANMLLRTTVAIIDPEMGRENYQQKIQSFGPDWAFVDSRLLLLQEHPLVRWLYLRLSKNGPYVPYLRTAKIVATGPWMPLVQRHIKLKKLHATTAKISDLQPAETADLQADFLVTYTSGTLSEPKGVVHTLASLTESVRILSAYLQPAKDQILATHLPHYMLIGLNAGVKVNLWNVKWSPERRIEFIEQHGITMLMGPPCEYLELMDWCKQQGRMFPTSLQHVFIGSAPVHSAFLQKLVALAPKMRITSLYGMTENLMVACIDGQQKLTFDGQGDIVGRTFPNVEIRIADDDEIMLKSPQLFKQYLHFPPRPAWHATGDLGKITSDGSLVLTGRKKDMIIRRNMNIYPGLYEPTINKIPNIIEAVMVGVYSEDLHDEVVYLIVESDKQLSASNIMSALTTGKYSIDKEALPDQIIFQQLPRKGRQSKVDKNEIRTSIAQQLA